MTGPPQRPRVAVTGFGVFSCFGWGAEALRRSVFEGTPGFRPVGRFDPAPYRVDRAAHAEQNPTLAEALATAAAEALRQAGLADPHRAAVLLGTQGDWTGLTGFWRHGGPAPATAVAGAHAPLLAAALGIEEGRRRVFNNGCVASAAALGHGLALLADHREDLVLAGGGYLVEEEFYAKFDSGRAFTPEPVMRPFSRDRAGLLLGDGVAVLALEREADALARGVQPLAILAAVGMAADSYHVCRPHPSGAGLSRAIGQALARSGVPAAEIGYVNAHGTATKANDSAETAALRAVFGDRLPPVSSTKSCTGHTLEGSGALEAVLSLIALRDGRLPPTAGFTEPDPDCPDDCVPNEPRDQPLRAVLSSSSAFGGANAALILAAA
ncbi:beta-ketoacyl-[acyl-carrier-protein] synthase family protein [Jatrophihabitans sp.]|uniref:beta-ketoacyl-[acyl-carrier-protein] synthase family protein n=1 Tax=Jatrophihabitans sp. TaxID=1932789 RepID=UPI002CE73726|nr:beta-ketoacyl synthase N-terminal-like domain-containing protein [Jatrophihabitans sp.]